jgi:hypothetical protein
MRLRFGWTPTTSSTFSRPVAGSVLGTNDEGVQALAETHEKSAYHAFELGALLTWIKGDCMCRPILASTVRHQGGQLMTTVGEIVRGQELAQLPSASSLRQSRGGSPRDIW